MIIEIDGQVFKSKAYDWIMEDVDHKKHLGLVNPELAWVIFLYSMTGFCESEIERTFFSKAIFRLPGLLPQVEFEKYRFDFGIIHTNIVIEIDGHDYHKTKEQRTRDAKRERYLESKGFRVVRFTGSEIYKDTEKCIDELLSFAKDLDPVWAKFIEAVIQGEAPWRESSAQ